MATKVDTIIIGAGIGGLALANLLAKRGQLVTIYEKNSQAGGRTGLIKQDGFRFDSGPSWYLMPEIFSHYFDILDEDISKHLDVVRLSPGYQIIYPDHDTLTIVGESTQDEQTFESREPGSSRALRAYIRQSEKTYNLAKEYFLYSNFTSPTALFNRKIVRDFPALLSYLFRNLDQATSRVVRDDKLRRVLQYPAVFLGGSPYNTPSIYGLMSYIDLKQGVYYPMGGMYSIIEALLSVGKKLGVRYEYDTPVSRILTDGSVAKGVTLANGNTAHANTVVSNADLHFTETMLLPTELQSYPESYWQHAIAGPSAILIYLGIKGKLPTLQHHNLFFTEPWKENFQTIFRDRHWSFPASLYVCMPSKTDSTVAPKGHENLFILVPGPASLADSPETIIAMADDYLQQFAETAAIPDLLQRIVTKKVYGPRDFSDDFNAWRGTALGMSHTLKQSALFRPGNQSKKVKNLYYVGAGTVPGIGLPMCLISAETVFKRLNGDTSPGPLVPGQVF